VKNELVFSDVIIAYRVVPTLMGHNTIIYEGAACQARCFKTVTVPLGTAFEYTTSDRIEDRATLESDSSGIRLPG